jgi:uncharacterized SAM-binding protein YcdF (DUF218 family)
MFPILSRLRRIARLTFAAIGLLYLTVSASPLVNWWARLLAGRWEDPGGDVLIVLSGGMQGDGLISESSYWRSVYAVRLYRSGAVHRILISGGPTRQPISTSMRDFLVGSGVPREAISVETDSSSTHESAVTLARLLHDTTGRKVLLTSDYHMFRAHRALSKAGLDVEPHPIPDAMKRASRWNGRWPAFLDLCAESVKTAYYFVRGWI